MSEYPKIPGPFKRETEGPNRNKLIHGEWTSPELATLADELWAFTEKIHGMNIRVIWDGHKPEFRGRTDRANLHPDLFTRLQELFPEELLEQQFGSDPAILYGEGHGPGIQKNGARYSPIKDFILFDVRVGHWWLKRGAVEEIAEQLGIRVVPIVLWGSVDEAISDVRQGVRSLVAGDGSIVEGLVGATQLGLQDRAGRRIMVKVKTEDFYEPR